MKTWLKYYKNNLRILPFSGGKTDFDLPPRFWLPAWSTPAGERWEMKIYEWAAVGQGKGAEVTFAAGNEKWETGDSLFSLLNKIESTGVYLYLLVLSYDFGLHLMGQTMKADFYNLPDWYLFLPARGYFKDQITGNGVRFEWNDEVALEIFEDSSLTEKDFARQNVSPEQYLKNIDQIRALIGQGEFYQLNYTIRFSRPASGDGLELFNKLYHKTRAPHAFYLNAPQVQLLSISPERFWYQQGERIVTEPIKGTIARGKTPEEDLNLKKQLARSLKDRSELNMITDLLRNDLSRVCQAGTVIVLKKHDLRTFSHVHHLVSVIQGRINENVSFSDLIKATFPGGSITGCPKRAAMQYINQFETHNRSFYTGALFFRFPLQNRTDSSILIRTALLKEGWLHYQAGGGIVFDSSPQKEYEECLAKAAPVLQL